MDCFAADAGALGGRQRAVGRLPVRGFGAVAWRLQQPALEHAAAHVAHAAPRHTVVGCAHHDRKSVGLGFVLDQVGELHDGLFLDLRAGHDPFAQAHVFRQADHIGVLVGHHPDPDLADDRAKMVTAGAAHGDGADDHQFGQVLRIGKISDLGLGHVATAKNLLHVHLGNAACRIVGVVVVLGVDHQAFQNPLHLLLNLVEKQAEFIGFDELRNVVVGVKATTRLLNPLSDHGRYGYPRVLL